MIVGHLNVTRPMPWDRMPLLQAQISFVQNDTTHLKTTRWSYTVPSNKLAFLGSCTVSIWVRSVVSAGTTERYAMIAYSAVSSENALIRSSAFARVLGADQTVSIGSNSVLVAGQSVYGVDYQGDDQVRCDYLESALITEFQA